MSKNGGPAYPSPISDTNDLRSGVSVRDYFAIRILAARLVAAPKRDGASWEAYSDSQCSLAYQFADKMLEARSK